MKRSKFVIWKSESDYQWYWHLKARNNEIVASSEAYRTKQGAQKGVKAVRRAALFAKEEAL